MSYLQYFAREEVSAYERGYRVSAGGQLLNPDGRAIHGSKSTTGYLQFRFRKTSKSVRVHRLAGFQKFGEDIYKAGVCVRHLDGNRLNNSLNNLALGTHQDNMMDKPAEDRSRHARKASAAAQKHSHQQILGMHLAGLSYKAIMRETGISSLGTVSYIVRKSLARQEVAA